MKRVRILFRRAYRKLLRTMGYPVVYNVNRIKYNERRRRVLFVYLTDPFFLHDDDPAFFWHQNFRQNKQLATLFGECGYVVDVADVRDKEFAPRNHYDLVISHRIDLAADSEFLRSAIKIYLASGMGHLVHNRNIRRRYEELAFRRGCRLRLRQLNDERLPFLAEADAIAGFGSEATRASWREEYAGPIFSFPNYAFRETKYVHGESHFESIRRHFLFFASWSQVGKGLDLLLEVFARQPHLHLYICSAFRNEDDFCRCYRRELFATPNIHPIGLVRALSDRFCDIVRRCAFVIFPTAAEGQSGSVIQCMATGLIPLVSKEAGVDTEDFGFTFTSTDSTDIGARVNEAAELPAIKLRDMSVKARRICETKYSEAAFLKRWREILVAIHERPIKGDEP